ncbi:Os04g0640750, partial [Oryza sativa Japonica Group]
MIGLAYHGVEGVALDALPVVDVVCGVVLAAGGDLERVAAAAGVLEAGDVADGVLAGEQRVLAGRLLAASPPRVAEDVDVGAPEREPGQPDVVHRPRLRRHHLQKSEHIAHRGGGEDGLREAGGAGDERREAGAGADVGDAVQRLRPPLVRRDPQPRQRRLLVHQEPHLLRQRQPPQQVRRPRRAALRPVAEPVPGHRRVRRVAREHRRLRPRHIIAPHHRHRHHHG